MTRPVRLQRSRQSQLASPNGLPVVCVDRSTQWGNPFKVSTLLGGCGTPAQVVEKFRAAVLGGDGENLLKFRKGDLWKLRGKNLACWCAKNQPCHADVLLTLSNEKTHVKPE